MSILMDKFVDPEFAKRIAKKQLGQEVQFLEGRLLTREEIEIVVFLRHRNSRTRSDVSLTDSEDEDEFEVVYASHYMDNGVLVETEPLVKSAIRT